MAGNAPTNAELAQQIANLTNVVAALANAVAAGPAAPQVAAPVPAVAFAISSIIPLSMVPAFTNKEPNLSELHLAWRLAKLLS